ncbi:DinB family protein [Pedococcus soli]|jgi:uncharacterized damage-inducible protein DinB|nr:hypothetical protein ASC58_11230 [Phycicoccus sp. Root101]
MLCAMTSPSNDSQSPAPASEREVLVEYLGHFRLTFARLCEDLTAEQLATRSVEPSSLSLLGLLRHLAKVEHIWFRITMEGNEIPRLYGTSEVVDADFDGAVADPEVVAEAWESWRREVAHAEEFVAQAASLELMSTHPTRDPISLRELLVHLIEEYARHCGHADLLRERIDGRTGH